MLGMTRSIVSLNNRSIKRDQLEDLVPKEWGHEEWIVNNALYCGKKLVFKPSHLLTIGSNSL